MDLRAFVAAAMDAKQIHAWPFSLGVFWATTSRILPNWEKTRYRHFRSSAKSQHPLQHQLFPRTAETRVWAHHRSHLRPSRCPAGCSGTGSGTGGWTPSRRPPAQPRITPPARLTHALRPPHPPRRAPPSRPALQAAASVRRRRWASRVVQARDATRLWATSGARAQPAERLSGERGGRGGGGGGDRGGGGGEGGGERWARAARRLGCYLLSPPGLGIAPSWPPRQGWPCRVWCPPGHACNPLFLHFSGQW